MDWKTITDQIRPIPKERFEAAWERLDDLTKPKRSLGLLEELAAVYSAIRGDASPKITGKEVFVFAGDHGVVDEGVSAYPREVTSLMVMTFLSGGAGINVLARCAGADVKVVDIGMATPLPGAPNLIQRCVRRGTGNILRGPAMSREEAETAIGVGIEMAGSAHQRGASILATGDMGIGNTTASSALLAALLPAEVSEVTCRGTGLDDAALSHKVSVIERALNRASCDPKDPVSVLAAVGGLEIAGICGLCLGGAFHGMAVMVDGFISSAGALAAMRICPAVKDYLIFSHHSLERGHRVFFDRENIRPVLNLDMRLGEGTGAVLAMQILENGVRVMNEMSTFADAGITPGA